MPRSKINLIQPDDLAFSRFIGFNKRIKQGEVWPRSGFNLKRTGNAADNTPVGSWGGIKWRNSVSSYEYSPVIHEDTLFYADGSTVTAADTEDGTVKWTYEMSDVASTHLVYEDETIYASDIGYCLHKIDAETGDGSEILDKDNNINLIRGIAVTDDYIYASADSPAAYKLDLNGNIIWSNDTDVSIISGDERPIVDSDRELVYVPGDSLIHALDMETGDQVWEYSGNGGLSIQTLLHQDVIVLFDGSNVIHGVDADDGSELWQRSLEGSEGSASFYLFNSVARDGYIYTCGPEVRVYKYDIQTGDLVDSISDHAVLANQGVSASTIAGSKLYLNSDTSQVVQIDLDTMSVDWFTNHTSGSSADETHPIAAANGSVYTSDSGTNEIVAISQNPTDKWDRVGFDYSRTGYSPYNSDIESTSPSVLWEYPLNGGSDFEPALTADSVIVVDDQDSLVYAVNKDDGTEKWQYDTGGAGSSDPAVFGDTVYVANTNGEIHEINIETGDGSSVYTDSDNNELRFIDGMPEGMIFGGLDDTIRKYIFKYEHEMWSNSYSNALPRAATAYDMDNNTVFYSVGPSDIYAASRHTGDVHWSNSWEELDSHPVYYNGYLLIRNTVNAALDTSDGTEVWREDDGLWFSSIASVAVADDEVFSTTDDYIYKFDVTDGTILNNTQNSGLVNSTNKLSEDTVYAGGEGSLLAFNKNDLSHKWTVDLSGNTSGDLVFGDKRVYIVADGSLWAVE